MRRWGTRDKAQKAEHKKSGQGLAIFLNVIK